MEFVRRALDVFTVVFHGEFVEALFTGVVFYGDGAIAIVLDDGFVYVSAGHFDVGCERGRFRKAKEFHFCVVFGVTRTFRNVQKFFFNWSFLWWTP